MNGHGWSSTSTLTGERQFSMPGVRGTFYAKAMRREPKAFQVSYKAPGEHEVSLGTVWGIDGASRIARAHADRLRGSRRATKGEVKTNYGGPRFMASDESPRRERIEEQRRFDGDVSDRLIRARLRHGKTEPWKVKNIMRGYLKGPLRGLRNPIAAGLRAWSVPSRYDFKIRVTDPDYPAETFVTTPREYIRDNQGDPEVVRQMTELARRGPGTVLHVGGGAQGRWDIVRLT